MTSSMRSRSRSRSPPILEPGEDCTRPSLAAGNDPNRPFDDETDRRVAEFKMSRWDGHDAARMRQLVKDLVHLAADRSGPRAEVYVLDERPRRFLRTSTSTMAWALDALPPPTRCLPIALGISTPRAPTSARTLRHTSRSSISDLDWAS